MPQPEIWVRLHRPAYQGIAVLEAILDAELQAVRQWRTQKLHCRVFATSHSPPPLL